MSRKNSVMGFLSEPKAAKLAPMLNVRNLVFDYPGHRALDDVSFSVDPGTITALVGPNGAGKSTLMRVCAALDQPFSGQVLLAGEDIHADPRAAHRRMGFLPDFYGLYDELTVEQCLHFRAASQGVAASARAAMVLAAAARLEIADRLGQKAGTLSRGLRQRLAIAQAVLHEPHFLMLDEPAAGLDPAARIGLSAVLRHLAGEGMTILVSSHILAELQDYSSHILMLKDGRLVEHAALSEIAWRSGEITVDIRLAFAAPDQHLAAKLGGLSGIELVSCGIDEAVIRVDADPARRATILASVVATGLPLSSFVPDRRNLQDIYLDRMQEVGVTLLDPPRP